MSNSNLSSIKKYLWFQGLVNEWSAFYVLLRIFYVNTYFINTLSANPTKWSDTNKQFVGNLPTNCLSMFDHFVGFALKGLTFWRVNVLGGAYIWWSLYSEFYTIDKPLKMMLKKADSTQIFLLKIINNIQVQSWMSNSATMYCQICLIMDV